MKNPQDLRTGAFMRFVKHPGRADGSVWKIRLIKGVLIHLLGHNPSEGYETGEVDQLTVVDWQEGCYNGTIVMLIDPTQKIPEGLRDITMVAMADLPAAMRATSVRKHFYIDAFLNPSHFYATHFPDMPREKWILAKARSARGLMPFLALVKEAFNAFVVSRNEQLDLEIKKTSQPEKKARLQDQRVLRDVRPPAFSTFCTWLRLWDLVGRCDARLLASRFDKRGPSQRRMNPHVLTWLEEAIDRIYLQTGNSTKKSVYQAVSNNVDDWNEMHPRHRLTAPSERQVNRYIDETIDRYTRAVARKGKEWADLHFQPVGVGPEATEILEIVEVDHTRAKSSVRDDITDRILGRPWITTALDRYSRMPIGIHVHFDGPSIGANMQVLRNLMQPKGYLRVLCPDITYDYPGSGVPRKFLFDRGTDFDSEYMRDVSLTFDIGIQYEPVGCPQFKGKIERWHLTMHQAVALTLPSATPRVDSKVQQTEVSAEATITFSDFVQRLWTWIVMVYAREQHRGIGDTPLNRWNEGAMRQPPRAPRPKDDLRVLLRRAEFLTATNKGIEWEGLRWNDPIIKTIRSHPAFRDETRSKRGTKVKVYIDDMDLSAVSVVNPVSGAHERIPCVYKEYAKGLTLHQHRLSRLITADRHADAKDERELLKSYAKLQAQADELRAKGRGSKHSARAARARKVGSQAPAGDDLGSLGLGTPEAVVEAPDVTPTSVFDACADDAGNAERAPNRTWKTKTVRSR